MTPATTTAPRISVVIIFLNPGAFLAEAIDSVKAQSFTDWELILVDDGSTDESSAVARRAAEHGRIHYLEHPDHANLGTSASRDLGLEAAQGEYLLYLDADDVLFTDALNTMHQLAQSSADVAAVFGSTLFWFWAQAFADKPNKVQDYGRWIGRFAPPKLLAAMVRTEDVHPANCSSLLRTRVVREIGGFEPEFRCMYEDTVLLAKLMLEHTVLVSDQCFSAYRMHPASQCHRAAAEGSYHNNRPNEARGRYLRWLKRHVKAKKVSDVGLNWAITRELWSYDRPTLFRLVNSHKLRMLVDRVRSLSARSSSESQTDPATKANASLAQALAAQGRSAEADVVRRRAVLS